MGYGVIGNTADSGSSHSRFESWYPSQYPSNYAGSGGSVMLSDVLAPVVSGWDAALSRR